MFKKAFYAIFSLLLSAGLIISIPLLTILIKDGFSLEKDPLLRITEVKRIALPPPTEKKKQVKRRPRRRLTPRTTPAAGPRFAMALGAQGTDGVTIKLDMQAAGGGGAKNNDEGVDERPRLLGDLQISVPEAVKKAEVNARVRLLFCVDATGRPYDIRISEEQPQGLGLAQSGREALLRTTFAPAMLRGSAVAFCGMEQPIEIKFRN